MKEYLIEYFSVLDAKAKRILPILLLLFVASSLLDMFGIGMIGVFITAATMPQKLVNYLPHFLKSPLSQISTTHLIISFGLSIIGLFLMKSMIAFFMQRKIARFGFYQAASVQTRLLIVYQSMPYDLFLQKNSAEMINTLQNTVQTYTSGTLVSSLQLITNVFLLFAIIILLLLEHPLPLLVMAGFFLLILFIYDVAIKKALTKSGKIAMEASNQIVKNLKQSIEGFKEIRVLGCENYFYETAKQPIEAFATNGSLTAALQYLPRYLIESLMIIFIIGLFIVNMVINGNVLNSLPMLGLFMAAGARLMPAIGQMMQSMNQLRFTRPVLNKIYQELMHNKAAKLNHATQNNAVFNKIRLTDVSYQYPGAKHFALNKLSLKIEKGQSVGIIGQSGAGKTTLIDILLGLLQPVSGKVLIESEAVQMAYIPQEIFILDDTLKRNIALGISDNEIDEAQLQNAIIAAQLERVVAALPQGLNTILGDRGVRLSGGQRQRVALARAFYYNREMIVMDEATASLDSETEREVVNAIKYLKGKKTLIVIAHRLSTVAHCDVLYRLEAGSIVASGSYKEVVGETVS